VKGWVRVRLSVRTVCERRGSACRYDCTFLIGGFYRSYTLCQCHNVSCLLYRLVVTFAVVCPFSLFVLGSVLNIND